MTATAPERPSSAASDRAPERAVPLTGADCFLRAFDAETRRSNGASHLSQLVLRLGPGLDPERLRDVLHEVARANPILRAPVLRRFGVAEPVYRIDRAASAPLPEVSLHAGELPSEFALPTEGAPLPEVFCQRLNEPFDARHGRLLHADLVQYDEGHRGADLALTWVHMLLDGSGSENFVRHLAEVGDGKRAADALPEGEWALPQVEGTAGERGEKARAWQSVVEGFAAKPPKSLAGPRQRNRQDLVYPLYTLGAEATEAVVERAKARAGFLTPVLFYLACAIRAHHAVFQARGAVPPSYVVPLPVNLRPAGAEGAIFRTRVSMMWFQVFPEQVEDLDALVNELKQQRRHMMKSGAVQNGVAAMDFARFAPARMYAMMARRNFKGELCSFFFAFTGDFLPGLTSLLGAPILNGFHTPSVPASPGSGAIMSLRDGRLNLAHVHQRGVFSDDELALFRDRIFADLAGSEG